jgi:hypothetical protein
MINLNCNNHIIISNMGATYITCPTKCLFWLKAIFEIKTNKPNFDFSWIEYDQSL